MEHIDGDLLSLTHRRDGHVTLVTVRGELDLATAPLLERTLTDLIDDQSCRSIVIDLHDLDFMGSTGLSLLLRARARAESSGSEITLARPSAPVTRTLQIAGLLSTFTAHGDIAAPNNHATSP